jgi:uncharacterized membrane protein
MRKLIPALVVTAAAAIFSMWAYQQLPDQVATHFNLQGEADGFSPRLVAVITGPGMGGAGALCALLGTLMPRIQPTAAAAVSSIVYSCILWKKEQDAAHAGT